MVWLLILFTVVPLLELTVLVQVGAQIGVARTILVCLVTGVVGASLARSQGMGVLRRMSETAARGELPAREMVDGLLILVAGIVLLTPGFVTDAMGILLLLPPSRAVIRALLVLGFQRRLAQGRSFQVNTSWPGQGPGTRRPASSAPDPDVYPPGTGPTAPTMEPPPVIDLDPRRD